jgi:hypothetical protein
MFPGVSEGLKPTLWGMEKTSDELNSRALFLCGEV